MNTLVKFRLRAGGLGNHKAENSVAWERREREGGVNVTIMALRVVLGFGNVPENDYQVRFAHQ